MKSLYYSSIQPYVDYNILNGSSTNEGNLECIRISLKKVVRIISLKKRQEYSAPLFKNLDQHIVYRKCLFMWKLDHNQLPIKLASNFTLNDTSDTYIGQRLIQGNYRLPIPRLDYAKRHITFSEI